MLSPSTAATDQTAKADRYKALPSLKQYVLVWQTERRVQVHERQGGGWIVVDHQGPDVVTLCDGIQLTVQSQYARVAEELGLRIRAARACERAVKPRGFRQPRCAACGLTPALCLCGAWPPLEAKVAISVVLPRSEARATSGSARLSRLWLAGSACYVQGDTGAAATLEDPAALLARPGSALLFPGVEGAPVPPDVRHLIVPDGTWSQALRIERRWFAAAPLPRVALDSGWPSAYGLRRSPTARRSAGALGGAPSALCTFEAIAIAIGVLGEPELASTLLARFAEWARRARWLKSGGPAPGAPRQAVSDRLPEHPALARLSALSW